MNPRYLAHAIADAMRDRVIAAHRHLAETDALEQAGIPVEIVRDAMERKAVETPATRVVRAWDGRGPLVLHGAVDNGKSHAAALWARKRWRQGRPTVWLSCVTLLSFEELDRALERTKRAPAVVLDELGAGLGGVAACRNRIAAWLQDRGQRPTFVTSNANKLEMETYLGKRLLSRLDQAGLRKHLETTAGLRVKVTDTDPETGRSPRWQRARWLVETVGYEPVDTYDHDTNRVVRGCRVGDALEGATLERLQALAMRFRLEWAHVEAEAAHLESLRNDLGADLLAAVQTIAAKPARVERHEYTVRPDAVPMPAAPALSEPPPWASRGHLKRLGFKVYRKRRPSGAKARTWTVERSGALLQTGLESEELGWKIAGGLAVDSLPPGYCDSEAYHEKTMGLRR